MARPRRGGGLFFARRGIAKLDGEADGAQPFRSAAGAVGRRRESTEGRARHAALVWRPPNSESSEHTAVCAVLCAGGVSLLPALCSVCCALL